MTQSCSDAVVSSLASVPHFESTERGTVCLAVAPASPFYLQGSATLHRRADFLTVSVTVVPLHGKEYECVRRSVISMRLIDPSASITREIPRRQFRVSPWIKDHPFPLPLTPPPPRMPLLQLLHPQLSSPTP